MKKITLSDRLRIFRNERGLSQQDLANQLGVGKITILRWENNSSKPSHLAAEKLKQIDFGDIEPNDTKQISIPRSILKPGQHDELRGDIRKNIQLGTNKYYFNPSSYVVNGPEDQLCFFEDLFKLQEKTVLPCSLSDYCKRLSLIADIPELGVSSAQNDLERPKEVAHHWNPNYGPHGWHRYVGRFPPHLVRCLLNHFGAKKGDIVCDPFLGSGTTALESRMLGLKAIGIEICPLSSLISRTKSKFPESTAKLKLLTDSLVSFYQKKLKEFLRGRDITEISYEEILQRDGNNIDAFANYNKWLIPEAFLGTSIIVEFACKLENYERDFVCCALSSKMRSIGNVDVDVVRAEYRDTPRSKVDVLKLVQAAMRKMISDINETLLTHQSLMSSAEDIHIIQNSCFDADIQPSSIDYIITSPPYGVESISYLRTHLLSYRCLQPILHYNPYTVDHKAIGSEYIKKKSSYDSNFIANTHSKTLLSFYRNVLQQYADKTGRIAMMMQFYNDMDDVAQRFSLWLRPGGHIAFVIGNKKIGDDVIPTDTIISETFNFYGLCLDKTISHKLKCNNSNSEVPWQERIIQDEYVMVFTKRD